MNQNLIDFNKMKKIDPGSNLSDKYQWKIGSSPVTKLSLRKRRKIHRSAFLSYKNVVYCLMWKYE
jgi:hypothetical protein